MSLNEKNNRRLPRTFFACLIAIGMLVASVSAYSDTYNFYFSKPKKKGSAVDNAPAADDSDEAEAAPPAPKAAGEQVQVSPNGQQPIIINNNNNIKMPEATPVDTTPEPPPAPSASNATIGTGVLVEPGGGFKRWHFGVSAAMYTGKSSGYWTDSAYDDYGYYSSSYTSSLGTQWSGLLNLGVDFNRTFGLNVYASQVVSGEKAKSFDTGGDFEVTPFKISGAKYDYVRLGVLAGTGVAFLDTSFPLDVGARFTINLDEQFGITGAVRTNFHVAMAEAGIVTHF